MAASGRRVLELGQEVEELLLTDIAEPPDVLVFLPGLLIPCFAPVGTEFQHKPLWQMRTYLLMTGRCEHAPLNQKAELEGSWPFHQPNQLSRNTVSKAIDNSKLIIQMGMPLARALSSNEFAVRRCFSIRQCARNPCCSSGRPAANKLSTPQDSQKFLQQTHIGNLQGAAEDCRHATSMAVPSRSTAPVRGTRSGRGDTRVMSQHRSSVEQRVPGGARRAGSSTCGDSPPIAGRGAATQANS